MSKRLKRILCNGAFLVFCALVTGYFVLRGQDFATLMDYLEDSSRGYWIAGFVLVVAFILCESCIIFYLLRSLGEKPKLGHCFLYSFVGFFFSLVTPTGSGGQPMQLVFMGRDKLRLSRCVLSLLLVTIAYKAVLVLVGIIILVVRPASLMALLAPATGWILLGIVLNVACVGGMLALVFAPSFAGRIAFACIRFAGRFAGEKRAQGWYEKTEAAMENYAQASRYIREHKLVVLNVFIVTIVQRCLLFAVTYVVLLSFGIDVLSLIQTVMLQGSISLSADMLPLPGGLGISEHLYNLIFGPICGDGLTVPTLVVSRGLAFYAQLLASAVFSVLAYFIVFGRKKDSDQ